MQAANFDDLPKLPRNEYRTIIKFLTAQNKNSHEVYDELFNTYGNQCPSYSTVFRWHREFQRGRKSIEDDKHTGRPTDSVTAENMERVRNFLNEHRKVSITTISTNLSLSRTAIFAILHDHLHYRKLCARWVPRILTDVQKLVRHDLSRQLLDMYEEDPRDFERRLITCDETWLHHYDPASKLQRMEWVLPALPAPRKARAQSSAGKILLTVFWDARGIILTDYLEHGSTINGPYYALLLERLRAILRTKRRGTLTVGSLLLQDNAPAHTSDIAVRAARKNKLQLLPHPPYSPDISPCDYYLFPKLKSSLRGRHYNSDNEVIAAAEQWFRDQPEEFYLEGIRDLRHRWSKCIELLGDYIEKQ